MTHYFIEPITRKYVKWYGFLSFEGNLSGKHGKNFTGYFHENRARCSKNYFQKVVRKTAETTGELKGKKTDKKVVKPKRVIWEFEKVWRNSYSTREKTRNAKHAKANDIKWNTIKYIIIDSTVLEIVTKNWIVEVNDISGGRYSIKNKRFKTSMLMENLKRFNL